MLPCPLASVEPLFPLTCHTRLCGDAQNIFFRHVRFTGVHLKLGELRLCIALRASSIEETSSFLTAAGGTMNERLTIANVIRCLVLVSSTVLTIYFSS